MRPPIPIDISKGWLPDYPPYAMPVGGLLTCNNLWPYDEGYYPVFTPVPLSAGTVIGTPLSGIEAYSSTDDKYYGFVGTSTKLYRLTTVTVTDVTRTSGAYTTSGNRWYFAPFGETMIATNYNDVPQILTPNLTTANFRDLGGNPPRAKFCISFRGRIIFGYLQDVDGTVRPNTLHWSDYENIEQYTYSSGGSDKQPITGGNSPMTGLGVIGDSILITHRHSLSRGFLSANALLIFDIQRHPVPNIGAIEGSLIIVDNIAYFFDERNIYAYDGQIAVPIGDGVKRTFLNSLDIANYYKTTTAYDPRNGFIIWCVVSTANSDSGIPDKLLVYNPRAKRFALISNQQFCVFNFHRGAMTLDDIDALYPTLDAIPYSLDSNVWMDNSPLLTCVTPDNKISVFIGSPLTWNFETGEYNNKEGITYINNVRTKAHNHRSDINVKIGYRFDDDESVTYTAIKQINDKGYANIEQTGKYLRFNVSGGYHEGLVGLEVLGKLLARR